MKNRYGRAYSAGGEMPRADRDAEEDTSSPDPERCLLAMVILQAVWDLNIAGYQKAAKRWLLNPRSHCKTYCELLGMDHGRVLLECERLARNV